MTRPRNPTRKKSHHSPGAQQRKALWQRLLNQTDVDLRRLSLNPTHYHGSTEYDDGCHTPTKAEQFLQRRYARIQAALELIKTTKD